MSPKTRPTPKLTPKQEKEFDIKFDHFNDDKSLKGRGRRICDGYCEKAYDLEDIKSFLALKLENQGVEYIRIYEKELQEQREEHKILVNTILETKNRELKEYQKRCKTAKCETAEESFKMGKRVQREEFKRVVEALEAEERFSSHWRIGFNQAKERLLKAIEEL